MRDGEGNRTRRTLVIRGLALLAVLGAGWVLGRLGTTDEAGTGRPAVQASGDPAARTRAGIPVAFPDTPEGAAAAVAAYQRAFASPSILEPEVMRRRIKAVATPDYAAQMLAANTPGRERIAAGPIGAGVASGLQTLYASVPIGYRIESFSPSRALVLTWGFTLLGNASAVEPSAYFGLTHTELDRVEGSWRIAATRSGFGPTPRVATRPGPLGSYDVVGLASRLTGYEPGA